MRGLFTFPRGLYFIAELTQCRCTERWQFSGPRILAHIGVSYIVMLFIFIAVGLFLLLGFWVAPFRAAIHVIPAVFKEGRKASFAA